MKLLVLKRQREAATVLQLESRKIGMECQDWTGPRSDRQYRETSKRPNKDKVGKKKNKQML